MANCSAISNRTHKQSAILWRFHGDCLAIVQLSYSRLLKANMAEAYEIATASLCICAVLLVRCQRKKRRPRSIWIKLWVSTREVDGAFHLLLEDLERPGTLSQVSRTRSCHLLKSYW